MAKTWENVLCTFSTSNTENDKGDSSYTVTQSGMSRYAPVNTDRAPDQVKTGNPAVAYVDAKSGLFQFVMREIDDSKISVQFVDGDRIFVKVNREPAESFVGEISRKPANGLRPFDCVNKDGMLTRIHVGHEVKTLKIG